MLDGMGIESVDLLHLVESSVPDALALAGGLSAVGRLDLIVALTPQVEVDATRVAVQAGAPVVRLRHAHPTTTLRRILRTGHVATYTTLSADIDDQEHVVVDHVVVQSGDGCFGVRVDDRPLLSAELVQVVASNPLAGLPRSPATLDPSTVANVTVVSPQGDHTRGSLLEPARSCAARHPGGAKYASMAGRSRARSWCVCGSALSSCTSW
jgi:hypothetical protein